MRKTYIIPHMIVIQPTPMGFVATSPTGIIIDGGVTTYGTNGGWVKEDTRSNYDVWQDDWSNQ